RTRASDATPRAIGLRASATTASDLPGPGTANITIPCLASCICPLSKTSPLIGFVFVDENTAAILPKVLDANRPTAVSRKTLYGIASVQPLLVGQRPSGSV